MMVDTCRHVNPMITSHINAQCGLRMIWNHVFGTEEPGGPPSMGSQGAGQKLVREQQYE